MSRRNGLRDRWLPHVLRGSGGTGFGCRLLLTVMYFRMTEKGYVSVPRTELAEILAVDDRQITRWIREAIDARLLDKVGGGYHGRTAEYAAVIPCRKVGGNNPPSGGKVAGGVTDKTTHLSAGQTGQEGGLKQPTQYARVTYETRQSNGHKRGAGVERNHAVTQELSDHKRRRVLISELSPWAQLAYSPLIAGRRRAALEQNHAGTVPPAVTS